MIPDTIIVEILKYLGSGGVGSAVTAAIFLRFGNRENNKKNGNPGQSQEIGCPLHKDLAEDVKEIKKDTGELKTGQGRLEGQMEVLIAKVCSK